MFGHLLGCYTVYTLSVALAPDGILPGAKFILRQSRLALEVIFQGQNAPNPFSTGLHPGLRWGSFCPRTFYSDSEGIPIPRRFP